MRNHVYVPATLRLCAVGIRLGGIRLFGLLAITVALMACGGGSSTPLEITYISVEDGNREVYSILADGSENPKRLTSTRDYAEFSPKYSPDAASIAFLSDRNGQDDLFMMDALGNGEQRAVEGDGRRTSFAWSPDGARIAYVSEEGNETEIHVVDVAEKQERRLTKNTATEQLGNWSPDGIWIVYAVIDESDYLGIYKKNPDGVDEIQLTENPDSKPQYSPNGALIAFESNRNGELEIYVIDDDGENETNVSAGSDTAWDYDWSPDSRKLVFVSNTDGNAEIYVVDRDGDNLTRLTNNRAQDSSPRWSPDGDWIVFSSNADGDFDLFVMDDKGGNQKRLTNNDFDAIEPDW